MRLAAAGIFARLAKEPRRDIGLAGMALLLADKGSRASAGAYAHRAGKPDRPARRQAHRTSAIAARRGRRVGLRGAGAPRVMQDAGSTRVDGGDPRSGVA